MIKKIAAIVPGPAVVFIGKWFELFSSTPLGYPQWQHDAENIALLISAFIRAFVRTYSGRIRDDLNPPDRCLWIRHRLGTPEPSISDVTWWQDIWEYVYIAAMVSLVATITVGGLYEGEAHPVVFWTILAIIVAILIGIAVFWWRSLKS